MALINVTYLNKSNEYELFGQDKAQDIQSRNRYS